MACVVALRVTPRAGRATIVGWRACADGREELEIRVAAAPTDGKANSEVIELLANRLGLAKSSIQIISGQTGRHKRVALPIDETELRRLIS